MRKIGHFDDIYRFFEHKTGADADELAQQTFMACVASRDTFRAQSTFRTYLFAIARNQLYSHLRRGSQRAQLDFGITSLAEVVTSLATRLGRAQQIEQLRVALSELPADDQLLLELHYWHELDAAALGEVFDASAGAIRVRLLRARRAVRARMNELGFALPTGGRERLDELDAIERLRDVAVGPQQPRATRPRLDRSVDRIAGDRALQRLGERRHSALSIVAHLRFVAGDEQPSVRSSIPRPARASRCNHGDSLSACEHDSREVSEISPCPFSLPAAP